jgi:hypothetical protein
LLDNAASVHRGRQVFSIIPRSGRWGPRAVAAVMSLGSLRWRVMKS